MTNDIAKRLTLLHESKRPAPQPGACGQMMGMESYRIVATGDQLAVMLEAAEEIERLSVSLSEGSISRWILWAERKPVEGQLIAVRYSAGADVWDAFRVGDPRDLDDYHCWMPLPEAPK